MARSTSEIWIYTCNFVYCDHGPAELGSKVYAAHAQFNNLR